MKEGLKVLMIPTGNAGLAYYRMWNFANAAYRTGAAQMKVLWWQKKLKYTHPWEEEIKKPEMKLRIFKEMYQYAQSSDVVIFQMCHIDASLGAFYTLKDIFNYSKLNIPILAEIDDNVIDMPSYNPASQAYDPSGTLHREVALKQFKSSDGMIVSTPYLADVYSEFNDQIYVVPNCIDMKLWNSAARKKKKGIVIGWAGGSTHESDLKIIEPIVHRILAKNKDVTFNFCHGAPHFLRDIPRVDCSFKWAFIHEYPKHIARLGWDIGIAPLVDNAFNRGKSNLRWLENSALGIPCVASKVGHFEQTIRHGIDGFLASDEQEFESYLQKLIDDRKLRLRIGMEAHVRVLKDFNVDHGVLNYIDQLKKAIGIGKVKDAPPVQTLLPDWMNDEIKPLEPLKNPYEMPPVTEVM